MGTWFSLTKGFRCIGRQHWQPWLFTRTDEEGRLWQPRVQGEGRPSIGARLGHASLSEPWLPTWVTKRAGFGSQGFEFLCHTAKDLTEIHHHHQAQDHHHGTRDKGIFGFEDASVHAREHDDIFGMRDMEFQENVQKSNTLFGFEDIEFERGVWGRDLFGSDDPDILSFRRGLEILGPFEADAEGIRKTTHVFGYENAENSDGRRRVSSRLRLQVPWSQPETRFSKISKMIVHMRKQFMSIMWKWYVTYILVNSVIVHIASFCRRIPDI